MVEINKILVVGSLNMDLVVKAPRLPQIGETVLGSTLEKIPGGKGANQAVSASKLGARTWMLGKVGKDEYGTALRKNLKFFGIEDEYLMEDDLSGTGTAIINVDKEGNNFITVIPGANRKLVPDDINNLKCALSSFDIALFQLEIPPSTVFKAIQMIKEKGNTLVILDPAPVTAIPGEVFEKIDIITPNLTEAEQLTGIRITSDQELKKVANYFLTRGVKIVILTLGGQGVYVKSKNKEFRVRGIPVNVVDSTAAGDCFNGALAAFYRGNNLEEAIEFANVAAALSTTKIGAQTSIPTRAQVENFLIKHKEG